MEANGSLADDENDVNVQRLATYVHNHRNSRHSNVNLVIELG